MIEFNEFPQFHTEHFHAACLAGYYDVVETCLAQGRSANLCVKRTGDSPLHLALAGGHGDVVRLLLKHGADLHQPNMMGVTPLHVLCSDKAYLDNNRTEIL